MGINIGTEDRYVIVEATGIEKKQISPNVSPPAKREIWPRS